MKKQKHLILLPLLLLLLTLMGCGGEYEAASPVSESSTPSAITAEASETEEKAATTETASLETDSAGIPLYSGSPYVELNGNIPDFADDLKTTESSEYYNSLDQLGRCGAAFANIGPDLMPTEDRGSISSVHPSGWMQAEYDFVDGGVLYNRCHLIAYCLTGENANDKNLITGTRYLNNTGMLPFEEKVAKYIDETGNHVLYRVTPDFRDSELVARGVYMDALSVEDEGEGICFSIYCYNVQPGVTINYETGESWASDDTEADSVTAADETERDEASSADADDSGEIMEYVLNTSSKKFHLPDCSGASGMKEENRQEYTGTRQSLIDQGYTPCGNCKP